MQRRTFLCTSSVVVSGCVGGGRDSTPTDVETPEQKYVSDEWRVNFSQWYGLESLPYFDEDADSVKRLKPEREWWVEAAIEMTYLPKDSTQSPAANRFGLKNGPGSDPKQAMLSVPEVDWGDLRLESPHDMYWVKPGWSGGKTVEDGETARLYALFDINSFDEYPWLVFDSGQGDVQLMPDAGLFPDGTTVKY